MRRRTKSKKKEILKLTVGFLLILLCVAFLSVGKYVYVTSYKITGIDESISPNGEYEVLYQNVGEPDFPFGYAHVRLVLNCKSKTVAKYKFDVANDGCSPTTEQWKVRWKDDCAEVMISGDEQHDVLYSLYFDGTVKTDNFETPSD